MIPQIIKPKLKVGEFHIHSMLDENGDPYISKFGFPFPAVSFEAKPWTNGSVKHCYVYTPELLDFFFEIIEKGVSYKTIEDYFFEIFNATPDVYRKIIENPDYSERYNEVKRCRARRIRDIVEAFADYEKVDISNKNTIDLAKNLHKSRIGVLGKIDKDYRDTKDINANFSGNLAKIILPSKTED